MFFTPKPINETSITTDLFALKFNEYFPSLSDETPVFPPFITILLPGKTSLLLSVIVPINVCPIEVKLIRDKIRI